MIWFGSPGLRSGPHGSGREMMKFLRKLRYGDPVVVVSGLPRSGTSMAMKMLEAGGLKLVTDNERTADEDNPKGYYEDERVKDLAETEEGSARGALLQGDLHAPRARRGVGLTAEDARSSW